MATRTMPFALTAAALASAATIATTTPDLLSARDLSGASAISPTRLSTASYELTAFADITIQGLSDAYWFGWGGFIQQDDPFYGSSYPQPPYPYLLNQLPIYVDGASGVLYYLIDNIIDEFTPTFDLDNYYFEIGAVNYGFPNASFSGLMSLFYVGSGELFGMDSQIHKAMDTLIHAGVTDTVQLQLTSLAVALVPTIDLGPIDIGGGILTALYFYGTTPDNTFTANNIGLPAIWSYLSYGLTELFPSLLPAAATAAAPAAALSPAASAELTTGSVESPSVGTAGFRSLPTEVADSADPKASPVKEDASADAVEAAVAEAAVADADVAAAGEGAAPSTSEATVLDANAATEADVASGATAASTDVKASAESAADTGSAPSTTAKDDSAASQSAASSITGKVRAGLGSSSTGGKHRADGTGRSSSAARSGGSAHAASADR